MSRQKGFIQLLVAILLLAGFLAGFYLVKNPAVFRSQATPGQNIYIIDSSGNVITETSTVSVRVRVTSPDWPQPTVSPSPTVTLIPTLTPAPTATLNCNGVGDVNLDDVITLADAQMAFNIVGGVLVPNAEQNRRADVDIDGRVSVADAQWILRYLVGNATSFPACNPGVQGVSVKAAEVTTTSIVLAEDPSFSLNRQVINFTTNPFNYTFSSNPETKTLYGKFISSTGIEQNTNPFPLIIRLIATTPTASPTPTNIIDTLNYFITKHPDKGLNGSHPLSQEVVDQTVFYTLWAGNSFDVSFWDQEYIYLKEDHHGAPQVIYSFTPGKWMKRQMGVGESITDNTNRIQLFDNACQIITSASSLRTGTFPIRTTLESRNPHFNIYQHLGIAEPTSSNINNMVAKDLDVIVLKYDSSLDNPNGIYEKFYYSNEWGWILWEQYNKATGSLTRDGNNRPVRSFFISIMDFPIRPDKSLSCSI